MRFTKIPPEIRFLKYLGNDPDKCWLWQGGKNNAGYGVFYLSNTDGRIRRILAHRYSWVYHNGPITDDLHVLHTCDTPLCLNPSHLFLGTNIDNIHDKIAKGRQSRGESIYGARLNEENVREIRRSSLSSYALAKNLGVNIQTICNVRSGASWKHVI